VFTRDVTVKKSKTFNDLDTQKIQGLSRMHGKPC